MIQHYLVTVTQKWKALLRFTDQARERARSLLPCSVIFPDKRNVSFQTEVLLLKKEENMNGRAQVYVLYH